MIIFSLPFPQWGWREDDIKHEWRVQLINKGITQHIPLVPNKSDLKLACDHQRNAN